MNRHNSAFTLLEILISLMIFAIIGAMSAVSLNSILKSYQHAQTNQAQFTQLQLTSSLFAQDCRHTLHVLRPGQQALSLFRDGWPNPQAAQTRSELYHLEYTYEAGQLIRRTSQVQQTLLTDLKQLRFSYLDPTNTWQTDVKSTIRAIKLTGQFQTGRAFEFITPLNPVKRRR